MSGVPYHAWTHRPKAEGGTDPIESGAFSVDSAFMQDSTISGTTTVSNNTLTDITMDTISIASGSTAFATHTALNSEKPIKCIKNGWYFFHVNFEWSGSPYTDVRTYSLFFNNGVDNMGDQNVVQSASSPFINAAFNGCFGPFHIRGASLSLSSFKVRAHQQSGSTQTITGVTVAAIFLGPDLDEARMPPF